MSIRLYSSIILSISALFLLILSSYVAASSLERVIYRGDRLSISLPVKYERRISFDHPVWADIPDNLTQLNAQIIGSDIYWTATAPFDPVKIVVGEEEGVGSKNRLYLFSLQGVIQDGPSPSLKVIRDDANTTHEPSSNEITSESLPMAEPVGYGALFRFAAQQLYGPERLRNVDSGLKLSRAPIPQGRIHHLIRNHQVVTHAMAAWRTSNLYITVLSINNATSHGITLDPRDIRGSVKAARFHNNHLSAKGSNGDLTTLHLVTDRPIIDALSGYAVRIDQPDDVNTKVDPPKYSNANTPRGLL